MPTFPITAEDRQWFAACRRSWDLGARVRQNLAPRPSGDGADDDPDRKRRRSVLDGLGVYYFPGMWTWDRSIVDPLMYAAIERGGGGDPEKAVLTAYKEWAPTVDRFTPLHIEPSLESDVPDPDRPGSDLVAETMAVVRYQERPSMLVLQRGDQDEWWLFEHRIVDRFADEAELKLDERGILATWAWGYFHLSMPIAGTFYNELRLDPPEFRRTRIRRTKAVKNLAAGRLGRTIKAMMDPQVNTDPTPEWSHCSRCSFRAPCIAMNEGRDATDLLAGGYERRPPEVLEETRLGGVWGLNWGAAGALSRKWR